MTFTPPSFDPQHLGQRLRWHRDHGKEHFVTLLVGAGFSKSAGVPLAGEIAAELADEAHTFPLFQGEPRRPKESEYAWRMRNLRSPFERARWIKEFVNRARDSTSGELRINWAHLFLATLVAQKYVNRILTTNFDPLIVEALALIGVEIRTYDLNLTGRYDHGILDPGSVIYLHGQSHSLLMANAPDELERVKKLYPDVLREAIDDSYLIVVGYSGACDPVLESLKSCRTFPHGLWWSHYSPTGALPDEDATELFMAHRACSHLASADDADTFMRRMVLDGIAAELPEMVSHPFESSVSGLRRIGRFPDGGDFPRDPIQPAIDLLRSAQAKAGQPPSTTPVAADTDSTDLGARTLALKVMSAATSGRWGEFDSLATQIVAPQNSPVAIAFGNGFLLRATRDGRRGNYEAALRHLGEAERYGVSEEDKAWLPTTWANVSLEQARRAGNTPEGDRHFAEAFAKYAEALRINPDMPKALCNWGTALSDQAELKGNTADGDRLFAEASAKYAEAVRIKPDMHEAFFDWGNALSKQATLKGNSAEGDRLFAEASARYAEAVRIKPDMHEAHSNWGVALFEQAKRQDDPAERDRLFADAETRLDAARRHQPREEPVLYNSACLASLRGRAAEAMGYLRAWKDVAASPSRRKLENDDDFDPIRASPEFQAFLAELPQ